jgi:hypothetical protein
MYVYICIYICVYIYVYIYKYTNICIHIGMADPVVLKPYLIKTTGPLIRVVGDRLDMYICVCMYIYM